MVTFSDRLKSAMEQKHLKQVDLIRIASQQGVKLGKSHISQYVSGKTIPRNDILHFLADTLEVDAGWLSCKTAEDPAPTGSISHSISAPEKSQQEILNPGGNNTMREFKKSSKLNNVLYDVRGPVVDEAAKMEERGTHVLKLNIGNPAPFGYESPVI